MKASVLISKWIAGVTAIFGIVGIYATFALFPLKSALNNVEAHTTNLRIQANLIDRQVKENTEAIRDIQEMKVYIKAVALVLNVRGEDLERAKTNSDSLYTHRNDGGVGSSSR